MPKKVEFDARTLEEKIEDLRRMAKDGEGFTMDEIVGYTRSKHSSIRCVLAKNRWSILNAGRILLPNPKTLNKCLQK